MKFLLNSNLKLYAHNEVMWENRQKDLEIEYSWFFTLNYLINNFILYTYIEFLWFLQIVELISKTIF